MSWAAAAFAAGLAIGWVDRSASEVQGAVLLLMLASFALTLPGRASPLLVGVLCGIGVPLVHAIGQPVEWSGFIAIVPALLGAGGGRLIGQRLDVATETLTDTARPLLAAVLTALTVLGVAPVTASLRSAGHPAPLWLAAVWQIVGYVGWIVVTPWVLRARGHFAGRRASEVAIHSGVAAGIAVVHGAVLVALTSVLMIPLTQGSTLLLAVSVYLPLDVLTYMSILVIGYASDSERHALNARLSALRARLNPHFLFNSVNSAVVLARSGKPEDTARTLEGLASLLRYVLDESRVAVPLREELAFVREYLELQRVRLGSRLSFTISCAPELESVIVPALLLQPLVENAVEHGVGQSLSGGTVAVRVTAGAHALEITIDDDGPGPGAVGRSSTGIGLASTRERLRHLCGDAAAVTLVARDDGRGARARITMPVTR